MGTAHRDVRVARKDYANPVESGFLELLDRHITEYRHNYRRVHHGKDIGFDKIAESAGITGRAFRDIRYGIEKPKRQTTINLGRAFGLGAEEIDRLLLTAGYEPKGDLSPAYIEDTSFESMSEKLFKKLKDRCGIEIQKCEGKISDIDTKSLELSKEFKERTKEYYKKRIEEFIGKIARFNTMRGYFRKLMEMTDEKLCLDNSNERIDFSGFPEELREGIKRRDISVASYDEAMIKTEYPGLYAILMEEIKPTKLTFGELLRQYRDGMTTREFGKIVPIDHSYLSRLERDLRRPSETMTRSIATALGLDEEKTIQLLKLARNL